jgi:adenylate kinase
MLNIILMGPPGAGKGTHATWIERDYKIPHISTGDMFREAMASGSELGNKVKAIINRGDLVSDELTCALVKSGYPDPIARKAIFSMASRAPSAGRSLEKMGREIGREVNLVINISCPDEELVRRITTRGSARSAARATTSFP